MQKIIGKLKDKNLYISLLITLVFFGIFAKIEFAADTYCTLESTPSEMVSHFMSIGRFVIAIWQGGFFKLGFSFGFIYISSYILAILCITLSIYNLFLVINKKINNGAICFLVSTVTIINPFTIELFLFIEKGIFGLTVLLTVLSFDKFVKYLDGDKKALKYVFIFMLIATFCYQGIIGLFIALSTIYVVFYSKNAKEFIKNNVVLLLGYGIPAIINLLTIRLFFSSARVNGEINLVESLHKIIDGSVEMLATYTILPKYTFVIVIATLLVLAIVLLCKNNKIKISTKLLKFLGLVYVLFATFAITIVPHIMENTASIWFVPRSTYPFGAIVGIICIYILVNILNNKSNSINKNIKSLSKLQTIQIPIIIIGVICTIMLIMQFFEFNKIEISHYNLNYIDKMNSLTVGEEIKKYEQETGNKVTKICIYSDEYLNNTYPNIWAHKDMNISGFGPDWAIVDMLNYYNNLDLVEGKKDPEIEASFKEQNWDNFSTDQIIFVGDTIHYCRF